VPDKRLKTIEENLKVGWRRFDEGAVYGFPGGEEVYRI